MIPREAGRGCSFKGAGAYYLHDKGASTASRVDFTHTENIPTQDPEKALKWMAWTAIHAEDLKRDSESKITGHTCKKPVFTFSLSWHPEEDPQKLEMIGAGRRALMALGLQDHEAVMCAHSDRPHKHLHVIVNVVDPKTGAANSVSFSKKKLSKWAEEYELERGNIYCEKRGENNDLREVEKDKHEEREARRKARITALYQQSDSGAAFHAALAVEGFTLATGKKIVVIDAEGKIHSLARQIDEVKESDLRAKLAGLGLPDAATEQVSILAKLQKPTVASSDQSNARKDQVEQKNETADEYSDRDEQDRDWQESIVDAALEHAARPLPNKKSRQVDRDHTRLFPQPHRYWASPLKVNALQDRQTEELGRFYTENSYARLRMTSSLDEFYGDHERQLRQNVADLESVLDNSGRVKIWWLKLTHQIPKNAERDVENGRRTLANIEQRKGEAQQELESEITRQRRAIEIRHRQERRDLQPVPHKTENDRPLSDDVPSVRRAHEEDLDPEFEL